MTRDKIGHIITIGFALFAMFFGAGNLLLPPFIGLQVSDSWLWSTLGFTITTIIIPLLGIIAVVLSGDDFTDLGKRVNKHIALVIGVIIMLCIGPLIAIPRTGATTFEVGMLPFFPDLSPWIGAITFFALTGLLALSSSKVVDLIGNYLTPALLMVLLLLIVVGIVNPVNTVFTERFTNADAFVLGFKEGYQTLDALGSVIFAGIIITAAKLKGYNSTKDKSQIVIYSGLIASFCLLLIYGGLVYLGATSGYEWSESTKRAPLLLHISVSQLGFWGSIAIAVSIALACLTTSVALTSAVGTYFSKVLRNKISYKVLVIITCAIATVLSVTGVDNIIAYAYPFLAFVYPVVITMILYLLCFGAFIKETLPFIGAILGSTLVSIVGLLITFGVPLESVQAQINRLPFASYDLAWVVPSFLFFMIFFVITKLRVR